MPDVEKRNPRRYLPDIENPEQYVGRRFKLKGYESAYRPSKPEGEILSWDGDWFVIRFDPDVRFLHPQAQGEGPDSLIPPDSYTGFDLTCFELEPLGGMCVSCETQVMDEVNYLCKACRVDRDR